MSRAIISSSLVGMIATATLDSGVVINGHPVDNTSPGEDVAGVPRWSGTLGAEYDVTIAGAELGRGRGGLGRLGGGGPRG